MNARVGDMVSTKRLIAGLCAGAITGAYAMALAHYYFYAPSKFSVATIGYAALLAIDYLAFTLPISLLVGFIAFAMLRRSRLLAPASVISIGLASGLFIALALVGFANPDVYLFFGFGGLSAALVCSLIIFWRSAGA
jgi:hypothetical protein